MMFFKQISSLSSNQFFRIHLTKTKKQDGDVVPVWIVLLLLRLYYIIQISLINEEGAKVVLMLDVKV